MKRFADKYRVVLSILVLGLAGAVLATSHAAANGACFRFGSTAKEYDYGGYHYKIIQLGINGVIQNSQGGANAYYVANSNYMASNPNPHNDPTKSTYYVINDSQAYINSKTCNGISGVASTNDYGGSMISGQPDEIDAGQGVVAWNDPTYGTIRPTKIGLGLAPRPSGDPTGSDGYLNGRVCLSTPPRRGFTVSLTQCNDYSGADVNRSSASLDDAGRLVIEGNGITRTIWCTELNTSAYYPKSTPGGYINCNDDIESVDIPAGTGFHFRDDQTCPANLTSPDCTNSYWTLWYKRTGLPGKNDLTPFVNTDAAGYVQRMYAHYESRNTGTGGFGAQNYFTLRYPKNGGVCSAFTVEGKSSAGALTVAAGSTLNLSADFKNTGTRPWRASDGYSFYNGSGPGSPRPAPAFPGGIIATGQHATFKTTVTAPAAGLTSTISWRVQQNGAAVATCSQVITAVNDNFNLTPVTSVPAPNGAIDNPTTFNFDSHVTAVITNSATLVKNTTIKPYYYVRAGGTGAPQYITGTASGTPITGLNIPEALPGYDLQLNNVTVSGLTPGDKVCSYITIIPGAGTVDSTGTRTFTDPSAASYDSDEQCFTFANVPYVTAYGGDVVAGGNFAGSDGSCDANPNQQITAYHNTAAKKGSGSQFRAQSTGQITGFPSNFLKGGAASFGTGLSFTNDSTAATINPVPFTNSAQGLYGGGYDQTDCIPDWYVDPPTGTTVDTSSTFVDIGSLSSGTYYYSPSPNDGTGNLQIGLYDSTTTAQATANIANGKHIIIYVNGNASIVNNIVYQNALSGWGSLANIPSVVIVAKGNLYIYSQIVQMDGVYVAQQRNVDNNDDGTANGGWVYTCASPNGSPYDPVSQNFVYGVFALGSGVGRCSSYQLMVNGAVIGQRFRLDRTGSSLHYATSGEQPFSGALKGCNYRADQPPFNQVPTCAAEVFNLSPEIYLVNPFSSNTGQLNSINDLPPIL